MYIAYQWEIHARDRFDDVAQRITYESLVDLLADYSPESLAGGANRIALIRIDGDDSGWAYLDDGQLPECFLGSKHRVPEDYAEVVKAAPPNILGSDQRNSARDHPI